MMTVKDVADLTGVTVKTLHHYHKIGLLKPSGRSKAGYRLYEKEELKLLQEILFYKELDVPLKEIKKLIQENKSRKDVLEEQRYLMREKMKHLDSLTKQINEAIEAEETGNEMDEETMFRGITLSQWMRHIEEHSEAIEEKYDVDISKIDIEDPNLHDVLNEVDTFMNTIEQFMDEDTSIDAPALQQHIKDFLKHWNKKYNEALTIEDIIENNWSYLVDDFKRQLLKTQRLGLRSYLYVACLELKNNMEKVEGEND